MVTLQIDDEPDVLRRVARVLRNLGQWDAAARASGALATRSPGSLAPLLQHLQDLESAGQGNRQRSATEAIFAQARRPGALRRSVQTLRDRGFHAAAVGLSGILAKAGLPGLSGFLAYLSDLRTAGLPICDDAVSRECLSDAETRRLLSPSFLNRLEDHGLLVDFAQLLLAPQGERHRSSQAVQNLVRRLRRQERNDIAEMVLSSLPAPVTPSTYLPGAKSTLMYRNPKQLALICDLCEELVASRGRISIHLFAENTGEEAMSLAIELCERGLLDRCTISASDISPELVDAAKRGIIDHRSFLRIPMDRRRHVRQIGKDRYEVADAIRDRIRHLVVDITDLQLAETFDVLLMQNVLPHLTEDRQRMALEGVTALTSRGGILGVGGVRPGTVQSLMSELGYDAITKNSLRIYEGWELQRKAWDSVSRPYWALPPVSPSVNPGEIASLFRRSR